MTLEQTHLHAENRHEVLSLCEMADTFVLFGDGSTDCEHLQLDLSVRLKRGYATQTELFLHVKALCSDARRQRHRWSQK